MKEWIQVMKAADRAAKWHSDQRRRGAAEEPYVNHLLEVARLVTEATNGEDQEIVIAALLHDAIEDQEVSRDMIAHEFGERVAVLVEEVSDDKTLPKQIRKERQIETAGQKSHPAKLIKLADKISNVLALSQSPPRTWSIERRMDYVAWAQRVVHGLRGSSEYLEMRFDQAVAMFENQMMRSRGAIMEEIAEG